MLRPPSATVRRCLRFDEIDSSQTRPIVRAVCRTGLTQRAERTGREGARAGTGIKQPTSFIGHDGMSSKSVKLS
jgi:hypothetical protein